MMLKGIAVALSATFGAAIAMTAAMTAPAEARPELVTANNRNRHLNQRLQKTSMAPHQGSQTRLATIGMMTE